MPDLELHERLSIALMLLGTGRYMGRPMPKHIAIPELSDGHFRRWLGLFRLTVEELCPPDVAALFVERAERIGNNFRIRIAQFRGEDPTRLTAIRAEPLDKALFARPS